MTTFAELRQQVYAITNRPDLVDPTGFALRRAIIKEHSVQDYARDLVVATPVALTQPSPNNFRYSLDTAALGWYPRLRKISILREVPASLPAAYYSQIGYWGSLDFKELLPDNIVDSYGMERTNYYYRQGQQIAVVAARQVDLIGCSYFAFPAMTTEVGYTDWMADLYPNALAEHAAAQIFRLIGKSDEYKMFNANIIDNRLDIIRSEIGEQG